jgi:DNA topoisomerase-3
MADKTLIIAEKPSVAADLARALPGSFTRAKTQYEGGDYIVSFAVGHLVSICFPEEIDGRYQKWRMDDLPIIPETFPLKVLDGTKSQFNALQKLIRRKDVTTIVNACDAGREGELIFKYIVRQAWNNSVKGKTFKRLWLQSMTKEAIAAGFGALRDDTEMQALEDTALCRSESDWLVGINATRALTAYRSRFGGFFLTPCGRVQTPTLSLLVHRERQRIDFQPRSYFSLIGTFTGAESPYTGKWIDPKFRKRKKDPDAQADRIWDEKRAAAIAQSCAGKPAVVSEKTREARQSPPQLYDLTSLQREANNRFGLSAKNTLAIAQALYERHKLLTYPRTDSRYLTRDYIGVATRLTTAQKKWDYGEHATTVLSKKYIRANPRIFNDAKVSDHHAIIPTNKLPTGSLSKSELDIYRMVVQRFLAVFFPPAVYLKTRRISEVEGEQFLTEGAILREPGWRAVYLKDGAAADDNMLPPVSADTAITCSDVEVQSLATKPPPRFSEATLLTAMEHSGKLVDDEELAEAMKERGLGTPATRAAIIEKLINEKYVIREGKELAPTGKAFELLTLLEAMRINVLASPEMTGEWEYKLNQILKGDYTRADFMADIRNLTAEITERIKKYDGDRDRVPAPFSPLDGVDFYETPTAYVRGDNKITIRKILGGRLMREDEVVALITGKTVGPFSDFRSKKGKPFTASVHLHNNKVEFLFAEATDQLDIDAITSTEPLGLSPIDQSPVYETPAGYMSSSALHGDEKKGLKISKIILAKPIPPEAMKAMLRDGKTPLIKGFISKKRRPFDAYLVLDGSGRISFEFPPRKRRGAAKKN